MDLKEHGADISGTLAPTILHEKSRSPPHATLDYRSTESQKERRRDELEHRSTALMDDIEKLRAKIKQLEDVLEDKDLQIKLLKQKLALQGGL